MNMIYKGNTDWIILTAETGITRRQSYTSPILSTTNPTFSRSLGSGSALSVQRLTARAIRDMAIREFSAFLRTRALLTSLKPVYQDKRNRGGEVYVRRCVTALWPQTESHGWLENMAMLIRRCLLLFCPNILTWRVITNRPKALLIELLRYFYHNCGKGMARRLEMNEVKWGYSDSYSF